MQEISTFGEVIGALGRTVDIADRLGVKDINVRQWRARDSIPAKYWSGIIELAATKKRHDITESLLTRLAAREVRAAS